MTKAEAQAAIAALRTQIDLLIPDNFTREVSPEDVRTNLQDIADLLDVLVVAIQVWDD